MFSGEIKNASLLKAREECKYVTVASQVLIPLEPSAEGFRFKRIAHGLHTGDLLVPKSINTHIGYGETAAGIDLYRGYYSAVENVNEFGIAFTKLQAEHIEENWLEHGIIKEGELAHLVEPKAKRVKLPEAWSTPTNGITICAYPREKEEQPPVAEIKLEENCKVRWQLYWTAEVGGTFVGATEVPEVALLSGEKYPVLEVYLNNLAAA